MEYKLAKKLKDAGFPQKHDYGNTYYSNKDGNQITISSSDDYDSTGRVPFIDNISTGLSDDYIYKPTLSELIDACVELSETGDFHLERNAIDKETFASWGASVDCFKGNEYISGKTLEKTVANLWLELNK